MNNFAQVFLAILIMAGAGCTVVQKGTQDTKSMLQSVTRIGDKDKETNVVEQVQSGVMREADLYVAMIAQATDDFRAKVSTVEARDMAQQWKLMEATAAYINATGERPTMNAVDMLVLATLSRYVVQDYWVEEKFGEAAQPLLKTHIELESNAWNIVQIILTSGQQEEVRKLLADYRQRYPHLRYVAAVRARELAGVLGKLPTEAEQSQRVGSLFNMLYLNPLAGLDPTTQAIQQTRLLAARMMYYAQRAPALIGWQAELTLYQLAAQPETQQVLSNLNTVSQSTKAFAKTAEELPGIINTQREAAINQIFSELKKNEEQLTNTLGSLRQTLVAGNEMAASVNTAVKSLDKFVASCSSTNSGPPDTNSPPFNILDYGTVAGQIGAMATNLTTLVLAANQSEAQISRLSNQATADAKAVVDHAFRLGVVLILLAGVILTFIVWFYRRSTPTPTRQ